MVNPWEHCPFPRSLLEAQITLIVAGDPSRWRTQHPSSPMRPSSLPGSLSLFIQIRRPHREQARQLPAPTHPHPLPRKAGCPAPCWEGLRLWGPAWGLVHSGCSRRSSAKCLRIKGAHWGLDGMTRGLRLSSHLSDLSCCARLGSLLTDQVWCQCSPKSPPPA